MNKIIFNCHSGRYRSRQSCNWGQKTLRFTRKRWQNQVRYRQGQTWAVMQKIKSWKMLHKNRDLPNTQSVQILSRAQIGKRAADMADQEARCRWSGERWNNTCGRQAAVTQQKLFCLTLTFQSSLAGWCWKNFRCSRVSRADVIKCIHSNNFTAKSTYFELE